MTYRELLAEEYPKLAEYAEAFCPCEFGYEADNAHPQIDGVRSGNRCVACWDREIPGSEGLQVREAVKTGRSAPMSDEELADILAGTTHYKEIIFSAQGRKAGSAEKWADPYGNPCCTKEEAMERFLAWLKEPLEEKEE